MHGEAKTPDTPEGEEGYIGLSDTGARIVAE